MPLLKLLALAAAAAAAPCDIFAAAGTPCVAAHSTVRSLFSAFAGALYQVNRTSDGALRDIPVVAPGGVVDAAALLAHCADGSCVISTLYDQTSRRNDLTPSPPGGAWRQPGKPVNATRDALTIGGAAAYSLYTESHNGYRRDDTTGVAKGNDPATYYMVTSGTHNNAGCCFDYGNAETNNLDDGKGTMEAVYFGVSKQWGRGAGDGPWVMADIENGLWAGDVNPALGNTPLTTPFVTAMVKGGENGFALKGGDATNGTLKVMWDGPRPPGYQPMKKQGAIILGIGGDNSAQSVGTFYEGAITLGYSTDAADDAVQADIVAARYGA